MSDSEESRSSTPPCVIQAAASASNDILPQKSQQRYQFVYEKFITSRKDNRVTSFSENVLMAYFGTLSNSLKPSTLWSMLRSVISLKHDVDISKYLKLKTFLKRKSTGFKSIKAKVLNSEQIQLFIDKANDEKFLFTNVALIFGICGACRSHELKDLEIQDVQDLGSALFSLSNLMTFNSCQSFFLVSMTFSPR
ncbi:hypothetical protein Zmor_011201 [Zophobas morio]|uniref:Uncharacterized protein n=1 Tax=Zophobas morio TaxID=2755281 RepID=A0AA38IT96_9CUCU|nr:hypothetical protein Zmor_011201 [Zophobas morio]